MTFTDFHVEQCGGASCTCDWVELFNGTTETSPSLGRFCGTETPIFVPTAGNGLPLLVVFRSNSDLHYQGFHATFESTSGGGPGIRGEWKEAFQEEFCLLDCQVTRWVLFTWLSSWSIIWIYYDPGYGSHTCRSAADKPIHSFFIRVVYLLTTTRKLTFAWMSKCRTGSFSYYKSLHLFVSNSFSLWHWQRFSWATNITWKFHIPQLPLWLRR